MRRLILLGAALLLCSGCTVKTAYQWGNYEDGLYRYYKGAKTPEEHEQYMVQLQGIIERNETAGDTVPPGIYAEYGYGLFQTGEYPEAIQYFEKEKSSWAEAVPLMDRKLNPQLIDQASRMALAVPAAPKVGALRQTSVKPLAGRTYFVLFGNQQHLVRPGSRVTVVIGAFRVENLIVE